MHGVRQGILQDQTFPVIFGVKKPGPLAGRDEGREEQGRAREEFSEESSLIGVQQGKKGIGITRQEGDSNLEPVLMEVCSWSPAEGRIHSSTQIPLGSAQPCIAALAAQLLLV